MVSLSLGSFTPYASRKLRIYGIINLVCHIRLRYPDSTGTVSCESSTRGWAHKNQRANLLPMSKQQLISLWKATYESLFTKLITNVPNIIRQFYDLSVNNNWYLYGKPHTKVYLQIWLPMCPQQTNITGLLPQNEQSHIHHEYWAYVTWSPVRITLGQQQNLNYSPCRSAESIG